jgi:XTP/dITP diphosphohydrolase
MTVEQPGRIVLVPFSPRVAPGLLSAGAWRLVTTPGVRVHAGDPEHPILQYLDEADIEIELIEGEARQLAAELLDEAKAGATVLWLADPSGDGDLVRALGEQLAGGSEIELELLPGSYDLPGAKVLDLIAVMDRLRSPGGCPWDAEQTHQSLVKYLLEEAYETVETIEDGDSGTPGPGRDALREELGDVLLQVAFHSRIAQEHPEDPFSIDEVAQGVAQKLIGRHPHVFNGQSFAGPGSAGPGSAVATAADVEANWDRIKIAEKGRTSAVEGVPLAQPALSLADKLLKRAHNANIAVAVPEFSGNPQLQAGDTAGVGQLLLAVVAQARALGVDPEEALRAAARDLRQQIVTLEGSLHPVPGVSLGGVRD